LEREDITGKLWSIQRGRIRIYQQSDEVTTTINVGKLP